MTSRIIESPDAHWKPEDRLLVRAAYGLRSHNIQKPKPNWVGIAALAFCLFCWAALSAAWRLQ